MANEDDREIDFIGQIKEKLIQSKQKTADAGKHITGNPDALRERRLPPGQHLVEKWPVLDLGIKPEVPKAAWELVIDGAVENPLVWDFQTFLDQPQVSQISDIHCVTTWSRYDNQWDGVSGAHIVALAKPLPEARHVIFHSYDGYTTNIKLDVMSEPNMLLAHSWEGKPLTREHGAPVRAIVPSWYFWKSAKWIKRIEFSTTDKPGFWEERGYHNEADPWAEQRYW